MPNKISSALHKWKWVFEFMRATLLHLLYLKQKIQQPSHDLFPFDICAQKSLFIRVTVLYSTVVRTEPTSFANAMIKYGTAVYRMIYVFGRFDYIFLATKWAHFMSYVLVIKIFFIPCSFASGWRGCKNPLAKGTTLYRMK